MDALLSVTLFLVVMGLYSLTWFQGLSTGVSTIGAERVLRGEIPYRDFWTMYAPGHFYLLALLFRIFGSHILVETVAASAVCAAAAVVLYRLVINLASNRFAAIACAAIFVAATLNTGYYKFLGSYPPAILSILIALNLMVLHYKTERLGYLVAAGLATGAAVAFKHDVGGYTAVAILAGLIVHPLLRPAGTADRVRASLVKMTFYCAGVAGIVLPLAVCFAVVAGWDVLQDLIIFPLTDFRFSRGEHYPSVFEFNIHGRSFLHSLSKLFIYINFTLPFALFIMGLVATGLAARRHKPIHAALGITFSAAYLLHYSAAHVQINTHIISMSLYAALSCVIFFDLLENEFGFRRRPMTVLITAAFAGGWFLSLVADPADKAWTAHKKLTTELKLAKVSGQKVSPQLVGFYGELLPFVDKHIPPDGHVFVGLHRHDVVVVGANAHDYFILDRPIASRYHELHPAIVDTAVVQREIIRDLRDKNVSLIILKRIFSDAALDSLKREFRKNLPKVGATDLDDFIRANYVQVKEIHGNAIWKRKDSMARLAG